RARILPSTCVRLSIQRSRSRPMPPELDEIAIVERRMHIDLLASTRPQQILLGFAHFLPAKNAHHPLSDRERSVRNRAIQINRDGATEPTAFRAGAKRIIEAEKPRRRRADVEVAMRAMPAGGEWVLVTGSGGRVGRS